jgi:hypothetical protein
MLAQDLIDKVLVAAAARALNLLAKPGKRFFV